MKERTKGIKVIVINVAEFLAAKALLETLHPSADWDWKNYDKDYPRCVYIDGVYGEVHSRSTERGTHSFGDLVAMFKQPETVTVTCNGKETELSYKDAKTLNLVD